MKKRGVLLLRVFVFVTMSSCLFCFLLNCNQPLLKIEYYVENELLCGEEFIYSIKNNTKICEVRYDEINICYYAENEDEIYAVVSKKLDNYYVELTYERIGIKIRISNEQMQYWCMVDYSLKPKNVDEEVYYNKIINCISEKELDNMDNCFNYYTDLNFK